MKKLLRKIVAKLLVKFLKKVYITAAAVIIFRENQRPIEVALVKEKARPELEAIGGLWNLPTEQVEFETMDSAAKRAGFEEAGVKLVLTGLLRPFHFPKIFSFVNMTVFVYTTKVVSGSVDDFIRAHCYPDDIDGLWWFSLEDIDKLHKEKNLMPYVYPAILQALSREGILPPDSIVELSA